MADLPRDEMSRRQVRQVIGWKIYTRLFLVPVDTAADYAPAEGSLMAGETAGNTAARVKGVRWGQVHPNGKKEMIVTYWQPVAKT